MRQEKMPAVEPVVFRFSASERVLAGQYCVVRWPVVGEDCAVVGGEHGGDDVGGAIETLEGCSGARGIVECECGNAVGANDLRFGAQVVDQALAEGQHVIGKERQHGQEEYRTADEQIHSRDSAGNRLRIIRRCHCAVPSGVLPFTVIATLSSSELMVRCTRLTESRFTENRTRFSTS